MTTSQEWAERLSGYVPREADVMTCSFETLLALEDQMSRERFEQLKIARQDFAAWLGERRQ